MSTAKDSPPQTLSTATTRAYAGDWALFSDWCQTVGEWELPADPDTVLSFLTDCPGAPTTLRRRVAAIDHHHTSAGNPRPGESPAVRGALGRPLPEPRAAPVMSPEFEAALRGLPSNGWTRGIFGRRDRCLLALSQLAGVPYKRMATLTAGDVQVVDGVVRVEIPAGAWMVAPHQDPVLCASCAVVRWLRVLDFVVTRPGKRNLAEALRKANAVTGRSPHLCRSIRQIGHVTTMVPLLTPIDQWGYLPFPLQRLTPHSLSRRVRDLLDGVVGAHRDLTVDIIDEPGTPAPQTPAVPRAVYTKADAQRAWARRRVDLADIAGFENVLDDVDARAKELQHRTAAILAAETER